MTLPLPSPQTRLSGQYLLELEVQGATPSALGQCADQQAEEDDEARMGKITSISLSVLRIKIGMGYLHLPTCKKWEGPDPPSFVHLCRSPHHLGGTLEGDIACGWEAHGWENGRGMGAWDGQGSRHRG